MKFRFLADHYVVGNRYIEANEVVDMPPDWVPTGQVEALDQSAVDAVWAAGPKPLGLVRSSFRYVAFPKTYWVRSGNQFSLTGLGANKPPITGDYSLEFL
jgi:hypothetical protein